MIDGPESNEMALDLDHVCIATISEELNISCTRLERVCEATAHDLTMQALVHIIIQVWPHTMGESTNPMVREYWTYHDELSMLNGVILKGM